jgi:hypothetical protein
MKIFFKNIIETLVLVKKDFEIIFKEFAENIDRI